MAFSFKTNELIDNYKVVFALKEGDYAQNYRVKDSKGNNYFLKLINPQSLHPTQIDQKGNILEIEIAKQLYDNNIVEYVSSNKIISKQKSYQYIVYKYISGQTLSEYLLQEDFCSIATAKNFIIQILKGLRFLHSRPKPIIHNELTLDNIMLDFRTGIPNCKIIDFGHARYLSQGINDCQVSISNIFFQPIEMLNGVFSKQSDLYSVGVLLYYLIFDNLPYLVDLSNLDKQPKALIDYLTPIRQKPPKFRVINNRHFDEQLINIICKALAFDIEDRFQNADQFIDALNNDIQIISHRQKGIEINDINISKPSGNGFKDVAGLEDLKAKLQSEVIDLINSPERAQQLGLHIPNGILFFGPPGCGKTFFAEKFAEQTGFNYQYIQCSDIASPYIHGGQDKIAAIFKQAKAKAPTILFFDEIGVMLTDRNKHTNISEQGEVTEFLTQLNNCGANNILVIGATNKPEQIDIAALRAGRLEYKYYIGPPEYQARKQMFEICLKQRSISEDIDFNSLAKWTSKYISADIQLIVDNAARQAFREKSDKITMQILQQVIQNSKPTINLETITQYENLRDKFLLESRVNNKYKKIGY